jgi:lipoic acid synthetase
VTGCEIRTNDDEKCSRDSQISKTRMMEVMDETKKKARPDWLRIRLAGDHAGLNQVEKVLTSLKLNTVCEEANCPNRLECFRKKTATFMILGRECTRNCRFCNVTPGQAFLPPDPEEPQRVAQAVQELDLSHVVITSVTRDDLPDGGAEHFARTIRAIAQQTPQVTIEVLIPDFQGDEAALATVVQAKPDIINHNIETVPRLYSAVRPQADYQQSLSLLQRVKAQDPEILTKSGIMLGLGETEAEVLDCLADLRAHDCDLLTVGQYLAPSPEHAPVVDYIHPDQFEAYRKAALKMGFRAVASAPLVRSSYNAGELIELRGGREQA